MSTNHRLFASKLKFLTGIQSSPVADSNLQDFVDVFTLPAADGASDQVLKTDGSGVITFGTVSAGGIDSATTTSLITTTVDSAYVTSKLTTSPIYTRTTSTATAGQTVFSATYTPDFVDVFVNGIKIHDSDDFIATNGTSITTNVALSLNDVVEIVSWTPTAIVGGSSFSYGLFTKSDPTEVAWTKTGAGTAETASIIYAYVNGSVLTVASGTSITMPSLTAGTDYAIWLETDGTLTATDNHTSPPTANARKLGGFHYAPGGNATAQAGGDTTPAINEYSFWDLKWRPSCPDPRGMTLVGGHFWADIYLTGVDHHTNGTSKYNVTIADGDSPPKVPSLYGGNGSTTYGSYNWWECAELLSSHGKRPPTYQEFCALAYGTTEAISRGTDPVTTQMSITDDNFTSKWGVIQSTGCLLVWGNNFGGGALAASYTATPADRGSTYQLSNVARYGGNWTNTIYSGSRNSVWVSSPADTGIAFGSRGVCDHMQGE